MPSDNLQCRLSSKKAFLIKGNKLPVKEGKISFPVNSQSPLLRTVDNNDLKFTKYKKLYINDKYFKGSVNLTRMKSLNAYKLKLEDTTGKELSSKLFKHDIYKIQPGDVNNDGKIDILLGVIKKTRFDPVLKKRLFVYQIDNRGLRPLWLGSRTHKELVDFNVSGFKNKTIIKTIENEHNGLYSAGEYCWSGFGLVLIKYSKQHIPFNQAKQLEKI